MSEKPLALTMGEPAGIGPELTLKLWLEREHLGVPPFLFVGDPDHLAALATRLGYAVPIVVTDAARALEMFPLALPLLPLEMAVIGEPGQPNAADAPAVIEAIRRSVDLVVAGSASAVVTNPIAKAPLTRAGFPHPGHTEFLAFLAEQHFSSAVHPVMLLWSEDLAVVPATVHVPLVEVPSRITAELIIETAQIVVREFRDRFAIRHPRLAFAGLNPHAGEDGTIGLEERTTITPAIKALQELGIQASGPYPADTMFHASARAGYDVAITMYHDQGLIPLKTLAFDSGVNVTLGLPFVRTSPDHGTAFGIAGSGQGNPTSLLQALKLARRLTLHASAG